MTIDSATTETTNAAAHSEPASRQSYFHDLTQALHQAGICSPTLIVDKQRLDTNIDYLQEALQNDYHYRIVAKSLPSIPLLRHLMQRTGSQRLMSFHLPFLMVLVEQIPEADILLGKPMPVNAVRHFYHWFSQQSVRRFTPESKLQWLVDSLERLQEYEALAEEIGVTLRINLEIDVGLHRGGFGEGESFAQALRLLSTSKRLQLSGLMGYEAHITKIPKLLGGLQKAFANTLQHYAARVAQVSEVFGAEACAKLCFNAGGSTTYPLYSCSRLNSFTQDINQYPDMINEIATASALVKPTDFDVVTLNHHQPACFIAAPVLKSVRNPEIPMAPGLSRVLRSLGKLPRQASFIYGGNWLAKPYYPEGCRRSFILGHSSNQELYELPSNVTLNSAEFLFFRPTQSEAVFLQFGNIALYENGEITDWWPVFRDPDSFHQSSHNCPQSANLIDKAV